MSDIYVRPGTGGTGGAVDSVSNADTTLIISPTTGAVVASLNLNKANTWLQDQSVPDEVYGPGWNGSTEVPTKNALYDKIESLTGGGGGNSVSVTLDFGASFTDKAQTVVTGQAWVGSGSEIVPAVLTPAGTDPDELYLLNLKPVISDIVAGVGFTVSLYSEAEAAGQYTVMCVGV